MGRLEHDLSLFNLPAEAKHWTLTAKKPGESFRRVEEAAEQYMKHLFVTEEDQVAKRRALEVQTAQQPKTSLNPRLGRGRKRSRVEGGVATAARPVKRVKEPTETWYWPSF